MKTNTRNEPYQDSLTTVGYWPVFWILVISLCGFRAAVAITSSDNHIAALFGGMALAATVVTILLIRRQTLVNRNNDGFLSSLSPALAYSLGLSLWFASTFFLLATTLEHWRGLYLLGDLLLLKNGLLQTTWYLAVLFFSCGLFAHWLNKWLHWQTGHYMVVTGILALCLLLLGPTMTVEVTSIGDIDKRAAYFKYSLIDALAASDKVTLKVERLGIFSSDPVPTVCAGQETHTFLIFGKRSAWPAASLSHSMLDKDALKRRTEECTKKSQAALDSGMALESELYRQRFDRFFARVNASPDIYRGHEIAADIEKLPEPLSSALQALLPEAYHWNYTAFDVALALADKVAIRDNLPPLKTLLPHQRQSLFNVGMASVLQGLTGETKESLDAQQQQHYNSQIGIAVQLKSPELLQYAYNSKLSHMVRGNSYGDYHGGYSKYDYAMANRNCDVSYAKFLHDKQLQPDTSHILHLLSLIGHAQYPDISLAMRREIFTHADSSLGVPNKKQLKGCVKLARFYASAVNDINENLIHQEYQNTHPYYDALNIYDQMYANLNAAIFQWWVRDVKKGSYQYISYNPTVIGDPAILIDATVEIMKTQPPSFEQYCAWTNTALHWISLSPESELKMVTSLHELPEVWHNANGIYQSSNPYCELDGHSITTKDYESWTEAITHLNSTLHLLDIPCKADIDEHKHRGILTCSIKARPWTKYASPTRIVGRGTND